VLQNERETAAKMAARAFAQSYLDDLVPSVFGLLDEQGFFYDAAERGSCCKLFHFDDIAVLVAVRYITPH